MKNLLCLLLVVFGMLPGTVVAGPSLDQGLNYFIQNDYERAISSCQAALDDPADRQDAAALLAVIYSVCNRPLNERENFPRLLEYADDVNPYFYVFLNRAGVTGNFEYPSVDFRKRIEGFLTRTDLNPTTRGFLQLFLVSHYFSDHKFSKVAKPLAEVGPISTWAVTGTFENISGSGFDKDYPPVAKFREVDRFENKYGAQVYWFPLPAYTPGKWIDLGNHFGSNNSVMFAQTFVEVPADREVQIRIGFGGSVKFWLNDQLILRNAKEYDTPIDDYVIHTTLSKGNNRLLLQIGENKRGDANFLVRITDMEGRPINDLNVKSWALNYNQNLKKPAKVAPHFAEEYFRKRIESGKYPLVNRILLIQAYSTANKMELARKEIELALEEAPKCSYLRYYLADIFYRDGNETSLNVTLEKLKADDPENVLSLLLFYKEAADAENYEEARSYLDKYKSSPWADPELSLSSEIDQAAGEERMEELKKLAEQAYKKYPLNAEFVGLKYAIEKEGGNSVRAILILKNYLKEYYDPDIKIALAGALFDNGDYYGGMALVEQLAKDHPENVTYSTILAKIRFGMGAYDVATNHYRNCVKIAPFIGSYHLDVAKTLEEAGKPDEAIPYYQEGLKYNPYNYDALRDLRKLQGKENLFDRFPVTDVYELAKNAPSKEAFPDDNSVVLLDEKQMVVYEEGGVEQKRILLAKAFTAAGVDTWKQYKVPYSYYSTAVIEKAEIIKPNGEKIKAETNYSTVLFTGLEPGDVVHVEYKTREYFTGILARHFWSKHYFQYGVPVQDIRFGLIVPFDRSFKWKVENGEIEPKVSKVDEFYQQYDWRLRDQKAIPNDAFLPELSDIAPTLHLSTLPSWGFVSSWYHDLADGMAQTDYEVEQLAKQLFGGEPGLSHREIVDRIYNYVVKEIRYSSLPFRQSGLIPQAASQVITSRIGDCKDVSTLFVALCREADIPASLVLVNTRNNGLNSMALPSIDFNHCIARVELDGQDYYTELTTDFAAFNTFSSYLLGAFALQVIAKKSEATAPFYLDPDTRSLNTAVRNTTVTFEGEKMVVAKDLRQGGDRATSSRRTYRDLGATDRIKTLQESLSGKYPDLKVTSVEFASGLDELEDPLRYKFIYEVNRPFTRVAGLTLVKVPFSEQFENSYITQSNTRETPVELWRYTTTDTIFEKMDLAIPDHLELAEVPANVTVNSPFLDYSLTFSRNGNVLTMNRMEVVKAAIVAVEDYPDFKKVIDRVVRADDLQLGFREKQ